MAQLKPFKAIYYNREKVGDISQVFCPPYDVISSEEQTRYHNVHPFNFIRILLGQEKARDDRYNNKYTRARKTFEDWLKKGILQEDSKACIYYYKQEYMVHGQRFSRLGIVSLLRLHEKEESKILPHENTQSAAKEDRLRLWRNVRGNLSPIFVCFPDKDKKIENIFVQKVSSTDAFIDIIDNEGIRHILWRLDDVKAINEIKESVSGQHLFIADGHHRYEVALEYRRAKLRKKKRSNGQEAFNFIMTYFTNLDSKDLLIFPIHRVIKKMRHKLDFLGDYFRIDRVKDKENLLILLKKAGQNEHAIGLYTQDGIKLLRLKNRLLIDEYIKEGSREFRQLDATILQTFVFDRANIPADQVIYIKDAYEAFQMVDNRQADACFIMNPVKIQQLKAIALNEERMPPKTTYFYPKVLSGLTVYRMDA